MERKFKKRVPLTNSISESILDEGIAEVKNRTGISYSIVYNLAHFRVKSLSLSHYYKIFNREAPHLDPQRVDPGYFRDMVKLWIFLNPGTTKKALFYEFYPERDVKKPDSRIFSGKAVKSIEYRLEKLMAKKFVDQGLRRSEIIEWINEMKEANGNGRVSFSRARPVLIYLEKYLGIHPSRLLGRSVTCYTSGDLKTISKKVYANLLILKEKTIKAYKTNSANEIAKLREDVYGKRKGFVLFCEVEEELDFLMEHSGKSVRRFLGRHVGWYKKGILKRIASWRIPNIRKECVELVQEKHHLPLNSLPFFSKAETIRPLTGLLRNYAISQICKMEYLNTEKSILKIKSPVEISNRLQPRHLLKFNHAPRYLNMREKAFDLLVANNCDIFRHIAVRKDMRWYIPENYLNKLKHKKGFSLLMEKYELLVTAGDTTLLTDSCLN